MAARQKSEWNTMKNSMKKATILGLVVILTCSFLMTPFLCKISVPASAEVVPSYSMAVSLNEYALDTQDSIYYAWRGLVHLTGEVSTMELASDSSLVAYFDNAATPLFSLPATGMALNNDKYSFAVTINASLFTRGYHLLRVFGKEIPDLASTSQTPVFSSPVYIEYSEIATVVNVTDFCNMRSEATTASAATEVNLGESVDVVGQVKGQYNSTYGTDIWYQVRYEKEGVLLNGYIISKLLSKMTTGISNLKTTAADTQVEAFLSGKTSYSINVPHSTSNISIKDIVLYNKSDSLQVLLNGVSIDPSYDSLPLPTGDSKLELVSKTTAGGTTTYIYNIWRIAESTEAEFQAQLAKFPESYKPALRALHSKYPNWLFTAFDTGLDWTSVMNIQDSGTTSLIYKNLSREYYKYIKDGVSNTAAFNDFINETPRDGTSFYTASRSAVEYYLDPRNFFDEKSIFQFEQLSFNATIHTLEGIRNILNGSTLAGKEAMFLAAATDARCRVSPYHLASRARLEVNSSPIATGTYSGANGIYYGYYNFYNIGTGSSKVPDYLIWLGLNFAKGNKSDGKVETFYHGTPKTNADQLKYILPWDTETKAITGGGIYIGENYINQGQDTLYLQKFDVDPINGLYNHQYMQNIQAPVKESVGPYNSYSQTGALTAGFVFKIPVYKNMSSLSSPKPEDTNKLSTLEVSGYSLTPAFNPGIDTVYNLTVPTGTEKVTITATTLNSNAVIGGLGEKALSMGNSNTFIVSCTPSNGAKRDYTIQITRSYPEASSNNLLLELNLTAGGAAVSLTPFFAPGQTGPFSAAVSETVDQVTLSASPQNTLATVAAGTGTHSLVLGVNDIAVTVIAQDNTPRIYQIKITRNIPKTTSSAFLITDGRIKGIVPSTTVDAMRKNLNGSIGAIRVFSPAGPEASEAALVGTGTVVRLYYNSTLLDEQTVVVYGDNNGDGKVNSTDYTFLKAHILKIKTLSDKYLEACDLNRDGKYNSTDYTLMRRHILRLQEISQK